jgi:hypothetical protein
MPWRQTDADMNAGEVTQCLAAARSEVEHVCDWLKFPSPDVLDRCSGALAAATSELQTNAGWLALARGDPDAMAEAWSLQRAVRRAGKLLDHAAEYHTRWRRMVAGHLDGYRPGGEIAPPALPPRICLQA